MLPIKVLSKFALGLVALAAASVTAAPANTRVRRQDGGIQLGAPSFIPDVFRLLGPATGAAPFTFTLHLNGQDMDGLASFLETNAQTLGNPLSQEQLAQYASPSAENLDAVRSFLSSSGFRDSDITYSALNDEVTVRSNVGQVGELFAAQFDNYQLGDATLARTKEYTIPASIASAVQNVEPLTSYGQILDPGPVQPATVEGQEAQAAAPAECNTQSVTPACLRALYNTRDYQPTAQSGKTDVFIAGFIGQNFAQSSLTQFLQKYRPDAADYRMQVINRAGALNLNVGALSGAEAMLDTETVVSQTFPLKSVYFNYGNMLSQGDVFQQAMADILNNYDRYGQPGVYTVSYGADERGFTQAQAQTLCDTAAKLTARGTTILFASGDNGVGGTQGDTCPPFVPTYPSGCQYITSVGATQRFDPEEAVDPSLGGFFSGSGFSNLYPTADFQQAAVAAYQSTIGAQNAGQYNEDGRGYPDVSAQGSRYVIVAATEQTVSGTSASAPTFASTVALINDNRRKNGKGNIGWFNPKAYSNSSTFFDVTRGRSAGCGSTDLNFPTAEGWDPSTGVGTPQNFQGLLALYG